MIKRSTWLVGIALAALVAVGGAGCKKQEAAQIIPQYYKQPVDMPKLRKTLEGKGLDATVTNALRTIQMRLRYGMFPEVLMRLDKLKETPGINDAQKQVIDEVMEQVKLAAKNQEAARAARQPAPR